MPIRTASLSKRISANGMALHRAMTSRAEAGGSDSQASQAELELREERRQRKEEREKRHTSSCGGMTRL